MYLPVYVIIDRTSFVWVAAKLIERGIPFSVEYPVTESVKISVHQNNSAALQAIAVNRPS